MYIYISTRHALMHTIAWRDKFVLLCNTLWLHRSLAKLVDRALPSSTQHTCVHEACTLKLYLAHVPWWRALLEMTFHQLIIGCFRIAERDRYVARVWAWIHVVSDTVWEEKKRHASKTVTSPLAPCNNIQIILGLGRVTNSLPRPCTQATDQTCYKYSHITPSNY